MLVLISKEELQALLEKDIEYWEAVGGGPNLNAFDFDPQTTDPKELEKLGYYDNRESWLAGARIKAIRDYLRALDELPPYTLKR